MVGHPCSRSYCQSIEKRTSQIRFTFSLVLIIFLIPGRRTKQLERPRIPGVRTSRRTPEIVLVHATTGRKNRSTAEAATVRQHGRSRVLSRRSRETREGRAGRGGGEHRQQTEVGVAPQAVGGQEADR